MSDLAIYDMDRTVTRRATYTPFLLHCASRRQQWRLLFVPFVALAMLGYVLKLYDRARLKEMCHFLLLGSKVHPRELQPLVQSFANATVASAKLCTKGCRSPGRTFDPSRRKWHISLSRARS